MSLCLVLASFVVSDTRITLPSDVGRESGYCFQECVCWNKLTLTMERYIPIKELPEGTM